MTIFLSALLAVGLIVVTPGRALPQSSGERHSGTVVSVDAAKRSLVLRELVEDGRPRQLDVRVAEGAAVVYSERIPDEKVTSLESPFSDRRVDLGEVRPGDFIVIEGAARGNAATASIVVVTLRPASASAMPGPSSRP